MTYELAKQLKDAGYKGYLHFEGDGTVTHDLSELIEACGDKISGIEKSIEGNSWFAYPYPFSFPAHQGSTPEEAVAKLWLELKKI